MANNDASKLSKRVEQLSGLVIVLTLAIVMVNIPEIATTFTALSGHPDIVIFCAAAMILFVLIAYYIIYKYGLGFSAVLQK